MFDSTGGCRQFRPSTKKDGLRLCFPESYRYEESGNANLFSGSGRSAKCAKSTSTAKNIKFLKFYFSSKINVFSL